MSRVIAIMVILLVQNYITFAQQDDKICGTPQLRATAIRKTLYFPANGEAANGQGICTWTIDADKDKTVTLVLTAVGFAADNDTCEGNRLDLYNDEVNSRNTITTVCGQAEHGDIKSTGNKMSVKMTYSNIQKNNGFKAEFMQVPGTSSVEDALCGKLDLQATDQENSLTFPANNEPAPGPNSCTWKITAQNENIVQVDLIDIFFASTNESCNQNMLMFFDGAVDPHNIITSVCGRGNHGVIRSVGGIMIVVMSYTNINKDKGFQAKYKQVNKLALLQATCGKSDLQATDNAQTITFPANDEAVPGPNSCTWTITAVNGMVVQLNLTKIEFGPTNDTCKENKLQVYDGIVDSHKIITSVCGKGNHSAIMSTGNIMILVMSFRDIKQGKGFTAQYMQVNVASIPHVGTVLSLVLSLSVSTLNRM